MLCKFSTNILVFQPDKVLKVLFVTYAFLLFIEYYVVFKQKVWQLYDKEYFFKILFRKNIEFLTIDIIHSVIPPTPRDDGIPKLCLDRNSKSNAMRINSRCNSIQNSLKIQQTRSLQRITMQRSQLRRWKRRDS